MGHGQDVEPHSHGPGEDRHCHLSAKYTEYIAIHLDDLKSKCLHLTTCVNKLLSGQRLMSVLKGENLALKKVCSLINVTNTTSTETMLDGKCSFHERLDIRDDVEAHIRDKIEKRLNWENVNICLENNYGDEERTTYVQELCGLAEDQDNICANYNTHKQVERFVNEQIEHLQCNCKSLTREHAEEGMSSALLIGLGGGGFCLLLVFFILLFFCCQKRKRRRKKKKKGPNVIYLPSPNADSYPVYQEIYDQRSPPPHDAPRQPSWYKRRPLPGEPGDEAEYLEPVAAAAAIGYRSKAPPPIKPVNNPGYCIEAPPRYTETDTMYEVAVPMNPDLRNTYFEPIVTPKTPKDDVYDTPDDLDEDDEVNSQQECQPLKEPDGAGVDLSQNPSGPRPDVNRPLGPEPAKRTKKDDRQTESEYFELEKQEEEDEDENS